MHEQLRVPAGTKEFVRTTPRRPPQTLSPRWGLKAKLVPRNPSVETLGYYRRPLLGQKNRAKRSGFRHGNTVNGVGAPPVRPRRTSGTRVFAEFAVDPAALKAPAGVMVLLATGVTGGIAP